MRIVWQDVPVDKAGRSEILCRITNTSTTTTMDMSIITAMTMDTNTSIVTAMTMDTSTSIVTATTTTMNMSMSIVTATTMDTGMAAAAGMPVRAKRIPLPVRIPIL